jgi:hypothetical protein
MDGEDKQPATMATNATNQVLKVDEDALDRDSKRTKLIQSEVEATAAREAQELYMTRLTEKQKLDMMEQSHQEQKLEIRELKSQLAASMEVEKEDSKTKEATALLILNLKSQLAANAETERKEDIGTKERMAKISEVCKQKLDATRQQIQELKAQIAAKILLEDQNSGETAALAAKKMSDLKIELNETKCAWKSELEMNEWRSEESEKSISALEAELSGTKRRLVENPGWLADMKNELDETEWSLEESRKSWVAARDRALKAQWENVDLVRQHGAELQERNDKDAFVEIGFRKKLKNGSLTAPKFAVKRLSRTFGELAKIVVRSDMLFMYDFDHEGRKITEADKGRTLPQVSAVLVET